MDRDKILPNPSRSARQSRRQRWGRKVKRLSGDLLQVLRAADNFIPILCRTYLPANASQEIVVKLSRGLEEMKKRALTRGAVETVKWVKYSRNLFLRFLSGNPVFSGGGLVRITKAGVPTWLADLSTYVLTLSPDQQEHQPWFLRMIMTLLCVTRAAQREPEIDLSPIITPTQGDNGDSISDNELKTAIKTLRTLINTEGRAVAPKINLRPKWKKFHLCVKGGPNGHSMWNAIADLQRMPQLIRDSIETLGGVTLAERIAETHTASVQAKGDKDQVPFLEVYNKIGSINPYKGRIIPTLRRLHALPDAEHKTRTVAILDYYSQAALQPLHNQLMRILGRIPQDCTFDQGSFFRKLHLEEGNNYHSLDLSNATDRLPVKLQSRVLGVLMGKKKAEAWSNLMVGTPFLMRGSDTTYEYSVGQPMGAYSSWASFTLTHHLIMCMAHQRAKVPISKTYCILGDDVLITNDKVASEYTAIMSTLGVEISPLKTHTSAEFYEFAKRWIFKGVEISPFPIAGLMTVKSSYPLLTALLHQQAERAWKFPIREERTGEQVQAVLKKIFRVASLPKKKGTHLAKLGRVFYAMLLLRSAKVNPNPSVKEEVRSTFNTCLPFEEELSNMDEFEWLEAQRAEAYKETLSQLDEIANDDAMRTKDQLTKHFPDLDDQSYEQLIMKLDPVSNYLARNWDEKCCTMCMFRFSEPGVVTPETIEQMEELAPLFIVKSVFTMRKHYQRILYQARFVKPFINRVLLNVTLQA